MILEHLPGLQDDALFLLRMDSTAFHFLFLHIPLHRTSTILPIGVTRLGKARLGRASAMHSPFFYLEVTRSIRPSRWFCPHTILSAPNDG